MTLAIDTGIKANFDDAAKERGGIFPDFQPQLGGKFFELVEHRSFILNCTEVRMDSSGY